MLSDPQLNKDNCVCVFFFFRKVTHLTKEEQNKKTKKEEKLFTCVLFHWLTSHTVKNCIHFVFQYEFW